ncbi:MAG TPA: hypothetical protein VMM36_06185 [Opitutaceae bacterium]|nr:hypothetical protein [Opitutaceae bacterium]
MKRIIPSAACAALAIASLFLSGCSTTKTYAGRNTSVLSGLAEVESKSYQPPEPTTIVVSSADDRPGSKLGGKRVSLFWGLFTFADY